MEEEKWKKKRELHDYQSKRWRSLSALTIGTLSESVWRKERARAEKILRERQRRERERKSPRPFRCSQIFY